MESLQDRDNVSINLIEATWNTGRPFISALRCPLSLASTISPLLLLLPSRLDGKGTGVEKLYQACYCASSPLTLNNFIYSIG